MWLLFGFRDHLIESHCGVLQVLKYGLSRSHMEMNLILYTHFVGDRGQTCVEL